MHRAAALVALAVLAACTTDTNRETKSTPPATTQQMQLAVSPPMRWEHKNGSDEWTEATLAALESEGIGMLSKVPQDIGVYCPNYAELGKTGRKAFWAGFMSALAKHESTYNPNAAGGGGRWLGLMQISPQTWRGYGCDGNITDGGDNMACAVRIMSKQVSRDNAIVSDRSGSWRGVARDWAPVRNSGKREDIASWTRSQSYCRDSS